MALELVNIMENGRLDWDSPRGPTTLSKSEWIAEDLNNRRPKEDDHIVCANCKKYMGVRKELQRNSRRITSDEKAAAADSRVVILGDYLCRCRHCSFELTI